MTVNQFEENVQSNRNDAVDSGVGFIVSFGFFATMFIIATVVQLIGS
nr:MULTISPECIES: YqzM family protein [Bacillaceae]